MEKSSGVGDGVQYWCQRWAAGNTAWHSAEVNHFLLSCYSKVVGKEVPPSVPVEFSSEEFQENSEKKWFVPLCGKTVDIPFLLSLGYRVFGVEGARQAIEALGVENNLNLTFDESRSIFEGADGRLQIYCGSLFDCPVEEFGPFDFGWDRGSFGSIHSNFLQKYAKTIKRAFAGRQSFSYLLEVITYDQEKFGGPPRSVNDEEIQHCFGDWAQIQEIGKIASPKTYPTILAIFGVGGFFARALLMTAPSAPHANE